jgi:hypothetical protein
MIFSRDLRKIHDKMKSLLLMPMGSGWLNRYPQKYPDLIKQ